VWRGPGGGFALEAVVFEVALGAGGLGGLHEPADLGEACFLFCGEVKVWPVASASARR
jgi:hypothetical protein